MLSRTLLAFLALVCLGPLHTANTEEANLPTVQVQDVRRVFDEGPHNAFTDLIRWQDRFWLVFRHCPDGHMVHPTSSIVVLSSEDTHTWQEEHRFSVPLRDTRDPHFLAFKGKLFIYTGTWYSGETTLPRDEYDLNKHLGYAVWTEDGKTWQGPRLLEGTYGHYIWRAAAHGDTAYLCGRRNRDFAQVHGEGEVVESAMLESDDGLVWKFHSLFQETSGDETAFAFDENGDMTAIGRRGRGPAQFITAKPPYTEMTRTELTEYVGGPLLTRWDDRWVVGGRRTTDAGPRTTLYWLVDGKLTPFAELPSDGDNSYPGFVELSPTHALVSWYSSHEKDSAGNTITAIYVADLVISE
ncbi:MAG: hypothetical protein IT368_13510 [Candidatus Hydrogenedentes bacterium]|nr:hypothetical protein [Candidatus Hydrogenedentota bacterium]